MDNEQKASIKLINSSRELKHLSNCLYDTGNFHLSEQLIAISEDIIQADKDIRVSQIESINKRIKVSEQGTKNMLNAVFAGVKIGEKHAKDNNETTDIE